MLCTRRHPLRYSAASGSFENESHSPCIHCLLNRTTDRPHPGVRDPPLIMRAAQRPLYLLADMGAIISVLGRFLVRC